MTGCSFEDEVARETWAARGMQCGSAASGGGNIYDGHVRVAQADRFPEVE